MFIRKTILPNINLNISYFKHDQSSTLPNMSRKNIYITLTVIYREDIYFFEANNKTIPLKVLKTSDISRVRSMGENCDVFNTSGEIYLVFTEKCKFSFYLILY